MAFKALVVLLWLVLFAAHVWGIYYHRRQSGKHLAEPALVKKDIDTIASTAVVGMSLAILGGISIAEVLLRS